MITVALPIWNSKEIAWLPIEGLCRQEVSEDWELLIVEEKHETQTGAAFFESYWDRLKEAGCVRLVYIELEYWVNLPKKWQMMANKAAGDVFCLQAADCYPDSKRLSRAREGLKNAHWTQDEKGHFYRVGMDRLIQWVQPKTGPFRTGLNMALRTDLIKDLPDVNLNRGIDHWMLSHIDKKVKTVIHTNPGDFGSLDVDGVNNISTTRAVYFSRIIEPFEKPKLTLDEIMPDLAERLRGIKPKEHFINGQQNLKIMPKRVLLREYQNYHKGDEIQVSACKAAQLEALGIVKQHVQVSRTIIHEKIQNNENSKDAEKHGGVPERSSSNDTGQRREVPAGPASVRSTVKKKRKAPAKRK
jgi:hypothetical protein